MASTTERAPWTGSTIDYDEAVGEYARLQQEFGALPSGDTLESRRVLSDLRAARRKMEEAHEEMLDWSVSRAARALATPTGESR